MPEPIADLSVALTETTVRATERAAAAAIRSGELAIGLEVAARLLLRAEGLASSHIEGVRASAEEVALAQFDPAIGGAAGWVADNLAAVEEALGAGGPITVASLLSWHRRLMRHAQLDAGLVGAWRDRQGWVGGGSPLTAAYVAPPASKIPPLMDDLIDFCNRDDLDPVTVAAVAHAQLETIHPFTDGNGRVGRVLIARMLQRGLGLAVPPPVSIQFARDIGGYLSGLTLWRDDQLDLWVSWFAGSVELAAGSVRETLRAVAELRHDWDERLADLRADSAARRLVDHLIDHPVVDVAAASDLLAVSHEAARGALNRLENRSVLARVAANRGAPNRPGRPAARWVAAEALRLIRA